MNAELRGRVLAAAAAEGSSTRAAVHRRKHDQSPSSPPRAVMGAFVIFAGSCRRASCCGSAVRSRRSNTPSDPVWLVVMTSGGALGVAATAVWLALWRGRSMLGRSRRVAAVRKHSDTGQSACVEGRLQHRVRRPDGGVAGTAWGEMSFVVARRRGGPAVVIFAIRRRAPVQPALNGAVMGFAAGACAWVAVDLWCPVAYVPHVLLGHVLPLFVVAGTGALLGRARLSLRRR